MDIQITSCVGQNNISFFQDLGLYHSLTSWLTAIKRCALGCNLKRCEVVLPYKTIELVENSIENTCAINAVILYIYTLRNFYDEKFGSGLFDRKYDLFPNDVTKIVFDVAEASLVFYPKYGLVLQELVDGESAEKRDEILDTLRTIFE